ncbi:MAG: glycosyltransferase family 4 protein [Bacteroides graminisolvens]|nr:glycosyltransferase family 4 protein [Bacteroides graminisolvens]
MDINLIYGIIFVILLIAELVYFKVADKFNIIDKPNERSSHSSIVLRGGGIIFLIGLWGWAIATQVSSGFSSFQDVSGIPYLWFLLAVTLIAGISFIDDICSLPDSVRLVGQFAAMVMMFYQLDMLHLNMWWVVMLVLIVCVGASNIINFMDGVNGITGAYAFASLIPLYLLNEQINFVDSSLIIVVGLADLVFCFFNFRPKGKAKCFAGDVGSIGVAYILLFFIGALIMKAQDITYLIFLLVYGVDGCLTICHRIMLHENLGQAHRKHAYQLMANELKIGHVKVSLLYMVIQLIVSLGFIYACPNTVGAHLVYFVCAILVLSLAYVLFKKKYYYLHEEYLASLENK